MPRSQRSWPATAFLLVTGSSIQFLILTTLAMFFYPGGTLGRPNSPGYSFTRNFFSDLGRTVAINRADNDVAALLFVTALTATGIAFFLFAAAKPQLMTRPLARRLTYPGSLAAMVAGVGFIGVAFTPADRLLQPHVVFVQVAFIAFLGAVFFFTLAGFLEPTFNNGAATGYLGFALLLGGYVWLLFNGPSASSAQGLLIQAVGQKIIVYAAVGTILAQSLYGYRLWRRISAPGPAAPPAAPADP